MAFRPFIGCFARVPGEHPPQKTGDSSGGTRMKTGIGNGTVLVGVRNILCAHVFISHWKILCTNRNTTACVFLVLCCVVIDLLWWLTAENQSFPWRMIIIQYNYFVWSDCVVNLLLAHASELCQTSPTERIRPIVRLNHVDGRWEKRRVYSCGMLWTFEHSTRSQWLGPGSPWTASISNNIISVVVDAATSPITIIAIITATIRTIPPHHRHSHHNH